MVDLEPHSTASALTPLKLGFVPLTDCAPLIVAKEKGLFDRYDLPVTLSQEPGWATIRDKLCFRELDAAMSPLALVFALNLGEGCVRSRAQIPLVLSANGNAITLTRDITPEQVQSKTFAQDLIAHAKTKDRLPTFAAVHPWSSHNVILQSWLAHRGLQGEGKVEILTLPPSVMVRNLASGAIDGFCVGEPWNTAAIAQGAGWCPSVSAREVPHHTEKVLAVNESFIASSPAQVVRLTAALLEAGEFCQEPENRDELVSLLAEEKYLGADPEIIRNALGTTFNTGHSTLDVPDFHIFHNPKVNRPTTDKANWITTGLRAVDVMKHKRLPTLSNIMREDLYDEALELKKNVS